MPQYKNLPRTPHLKTNNEFISWVDHAIRWIVPYWKAGLGLAGILFVIGMGYLAVRYGSEEVSGNLSRVIFEADSKPEDQRAQAYKQIIQDYASKPQSVFVAWRLSRLLLETGKIDEASQIFEHSRIHAPESFLPLLQISQAQLAWQRGQLEDGLKILDGIQQKGQGEENNANLFALIVKGEILEALNKKDEAKKVYNEIIAESGEDPLVQKMARARLVSLAALGEK